MNDTMKKGLLALFVIGMIGIAGQEELKEYRMNEELKKCLNSTDGTDTECDSCFEAIYGVKELPWTDLR